MQVLQHPDFFPARSGMLPLQVLHIIFQDVHLHLPPAHRQISLDLFCHSFHNNSDFLQKTRLNYKNAHPHTPSCRHAPRYAIRNHLQMRIFFLHHIIKSAIALLVIRSEILISNLKISQPKRLSVSHLCS